VVERKDMTAEEPEAVVASEGTGETTTEIAESKPSASAPTPATTGRKAPGAKEQIPFRWKLLGESAGMILTLFKGTERGDVEAQYDRVRKEGYYVNLRIVDIDQKTIQPVPERPRKVARKIVKTPDTPKTPKAQQQTQKTRRSARAAKTERQPKPRPAARVGKAKSTAAPKRTRKKTTDSGATTKKKRTTRKKKR